MHKVKKKKKTESYHSLRLNIKPLVEPQKFRTLETLNS